MTTGKRITGSYLDSLNFPSTITPKTTQISDLQKNLLNSGALDLVDHTDPFGRSCKAYAGFKNPHDDTIQQIAQKIADQKAQLPDDWNHATYSQRAEVPGQLIGPGQPTRKLTDIEIRDIDFVEGAIKDITFLSNRQSGMCVTEYTDSNAQWTVMGNTAKYGTSVALPTTPSSPGGIAIPGLSGYMSMVSSFSSLANVLTNIPSTASGPCKFIESAMGALMKAGSILGEILSKILQVAGIMALAMAVIGLAKLLIDIIKEDLKYLGNILEKLLQAALAGLLGELAKDPCMAYLLTAGIATATTLKNLDLI
tara:strand:+ start:7128 stop:8057 length:930 start_codon:yes stop_codon:yes gene_type:complete